jgi:hypothetical protein
MSILDESAKQMLERLEHEVRGKAKTSLRNIVSACDKIELTRGTMNYEKVGRLATELFGGPLASSIRNNIILKGYIAKRIEEYEAVSRGRIRGRSVEEQVRPVRAKYPVEGLDAKSRIFIDTIQLHLHRLSEENRYLSELLEQKTLAAPIELSDSISRGPTIGGELASAIPPTDMPAALRQAVRILLGVDTTDGRFESFAVRRRSDEQMLVCVDAGVERTLLSPSDWAVAVAWLEESGEGAACSGHSGG